MIRSELVSYLIQLGALVAGVFGLYGAFSHKAIFFPLVGGLLAWNVGKWMRKKTF